VGPALLLWPEAAPGGLLVKSRYAVARALRPAIVAAWLTRWRHSHLLGCGARSDCHRPQRQFLSLLPLFVAVKQEFAARVIGFVTVTRGAHRGRQPGNR
jgi:hypothetical protein